MNNVQFPVRALSLLAAAVILATSQKASAVTLRTVPSSIHQIGTSGAVSLGHTAIGSTDFNRLVVSGGYIATCASAVMVPTNGQRSLSGEAAFGGVILYTTIPERLPAFVEMPGFDLLAAGSRVACAYNWSSKAVESNFTIGIPGFGITIGGGERSEGGTYPFMMVKPAETNEREDEGCA